MWCSRAQIRSVKTSVRRLHELMEPTSWGAPGFWSATATLEHSVTLSSIPGAAVDAEWAEQPLQDERTCERPDVVTRAERWQFSKVNVRQHPLRVAER